MKKIACLKGVAVLATAAGMLVARAAVVESTDAETGYKVLTVEAGEFAEYATVLDASVPGLIKRGAGTAWLTGANSTFVGPIQIEAGVLGANNGAFGKTGNLTILSGATLDVTKQANSAMNTRKVSFEGIGLGGIGAIICTNYSGYSNRDAMFKNVEMTGDATWESSARHGMTSGGFTKAGGGKLTLKGANTYAGETVISGGTLAFGDAAGFPAGGDLTVSNGASVILAAATTVGRFTGPGSVSGADVTVTNAVRASCSDIFANKHATFANTLTFAAGATFVITDPENLETYAHSGSKPAFTAQTVNGTPIVTFEGEYDGPTKWALFKKGDNAYNFGPLVGTMLLVK